MNAKGTTPTVFNIISVLVLVVALAGPVGAHVKDSFDHLWGEHIKPKIADPGTINDAGNPVDWSKLKNVPAGIADGSDYGIEGAGFGLKVVRPLLGKRYFTVEPEEVQKRVTGTCSAGAISAVNQDGTVSCTSGDADGPIAFSVSDDDTGIFCNIDFCTEGTLTGVPLGTWLVSASITANCELIDHCDEQGLHIECHLNAGQTVIETSEVLIWEGRTWIFPMTLDDIHFFEGNVSLACRDRGDASVSADYKGVNMSITAVSLGSLNQ